MNAFRIGVFLAVAGGAYWAYSLSDENRRPVHPLIPRLVDQALDQPSNVCVEAGPFPYDTALPPTYWNAYIGNYATCEAIPCNRCEDLRAAGLLKKWTGELRDENGDKRVAVQYELTEEGRALYHADIRDYGVSGSAQPHCRLGDTMTGKTPAYERKPGLCFAKQMKFYKVEARLKPMQFGGNSVQGFKYVAQAVEPQPFIFDPRAKALLPMVPARGTPALYPPVTTALVLYPGGKDGELDGSIRYGKWINEK